MACVPAPRRLRVLHPAAGEWVRRKLRAHRAHYGHGAILERRRRASRQACIPPQLAAIIELMFYVAGECSSGAARPACGYAAPVDTTSLEEQSALIALLTVRPGKLTWSATTSQVIESGSAADVWRRHVPETLPGIAPAQDPLEVARKQVLGWHREEFSLVTILDQDYPARLRDVHQAPPVLFAHGASMTDDRAVSVVGSRTASRPGLAFASRTARSLVSAGFTVASGLAAGIDTAAHAAALDAAGRTVAVIGTGIRRTYPAQNRELQATIANRGLVLSQFWPDAPPQKQNFLMRNATMSGYGVATVVVEAGETSGARAQARIAVEHGRPVILTRMVVDGNEWPQPLLGRPGVHVADRVEDIVDIVQTIAREDAALPTLAAPATSG